MIKNPTALKLCPFDFSRIVFRWVMVLSLATIACGPEGKGHASHADKYTCPMHPQIIKDSPGTCPICKMDLVKKDKQEADSKQLVLSPEQVSLANITTRKIDSGTFSTSKLLNARVVANPEAEEVIASRYPGRIEKLFVRENGIQVSKGQPLFQIYSEEIQALQLDYLLQIKQAKAFPSEEIYKTLKTAARNKLQLYGFSTSQLTSLEKSNKASPLTNVYASASGIVTELNITEGGYVSEGEPVMRVQNLGSLWIEADVYPAEANLIKQGMTVRVSVEGMPEVNGKINFVSPALNANSQILVARVNITNNGNLQPGMRATVALVSERTSKAVLLPVDAVVREEDASYVWIKTDKDTFEQRKVEIGMEDEHSVVIKSGLKNAKEVVITGAYLLNSELQLR